MLIPLSWLNDYIDIPESVEELRDLLTFSGLEVESVQIHGSEFTGLCVAEITAVDPHPNADKLTLCTVDTGEDSIQVVCGAPNVAVGLKTIYAPVGVTLPNGLKLKRAKIRGVESLGMLCAEDELGLSSDHAGIMELSPELVAGTPAVDILGGPEVVFELEVTPNRPDCLSLIGVARELAALTGRPLRIPKVEYTDGADHPAVQISIQDPEACPRYTARRLQGATVKPSPDWMQQRLRLCGIRPINNLVDITNYVMLETGQPLHAFDARLLKGNGLEIRCAVQGEKMQTLDGKEHKLSPSDVVIADAGGAVALAGVMGGANSDIRDNTQEVILESAAFLPSRVRHTAKRLQTHTDSSYRFARGCDMSNVEWVSRRAARLMVDLSGATPSAPLSDHFPGKQSPRTLTCQWESITSLIGVDIAPETMKGYFRQLGLEILESDDTSCTVQIPGFRLDLTRPVDLTEEVARLNGLDAIPVRAPVATLVPGADDFATRQEFEVCRHLAALGWLEATHYSLSSETARSGLDTQPVVTLPNPISQDQSLLRSSLLPQMVESLAFNRAHQADSVALFECGKVFFPAADGVGECLHLCLGTYGARKRAHLDGQRPTTSDEAFLNLKGELESVFRMLRVLEDIRFEACEYAGLTPGQAARVIFKQNEIGRIGLLDSSLLERRKLVGPVALAELSLQPLLPSKRRMAKMKPIPAFPAITRDVALIVDRCRTHQEVVDQVQQNRPRDLEQFEVFDVFESDKLGKNRKSMAYRFVYRNANKTLTDKAVEKMHSQLVDRLVEALQAEISGR